MITANPYRHLLLAILWLGLPFALAVDALAASAADEVATDDPWVRALPPGASVAAAFLQLTNEGPSARRLVGAASPCAGSIELHEHIHQDGVMQMRPVPHIDLPPGSPVALEPGGLHLMLFDLNCPLTADTAIEIELEFADGSTRSLSAPVADR